MDPRLLARLREPACYPGKVDAVELRQTHLSVVCLAGEFAYKLKKPVRFSFADFSTRELRQHFCEEEVRLNRRLCPDVYLDVVPLRRTGDGSWSFRADARGEVEEWAVRMRRLPEDRLLDHLLAEDRVTEEQIREVARIMARFHAGNAATGQALEAGSPARKAEAILANFAALDQCRELGFSTELLEAIRARAGADLKRWSPLLEERARRGRVVDGHGDLHARNICLTSPPVIFDCIEFRPEFRCGDVAAENAFLVMDLRRRGHPELARAYLDTYLAESGDEEQLLLLPLFLSYRAMVRAKVSALEARDPDIPDAHRRRAREEVTGYLQLAAASALSQDRILLLACGLPGAGKSHLCQALADSSGWPVIASDRVRKELAGVPPGERLPPECYLPEFTLRTYRELLRRAALLLPSGPVIADANFPRASLRAEAAAASRAAGGLACVLWTQAGESAVACRLLQRESTPGTVSDAGWDTYQKLRSTFEPPQSQEGLPLLPVDGRAPVTGNVDRILTWLLCDVSRSGLQT